MTVTLNRVQQDFISHWTRIEQENTKGHLDTSPKESAQRAYQVLENAALSSLPFLVIGPQLRRQKDLIQNLGYIKADSKDLTGSVLGEPRWSLPINDAFILGGILSKKEFILSMRDLPSDSLIWDSEHNCLTTLGRELCILQSAGYKRSMVQSEYGIHFQREKTLREIDLSFRDLWKKLQEITSLESAKMFINLL